MISYNSSRDVSRLSPRNRVMFLVAPRGTRSLKTIEYTGCEDYLKTDTTDNLHECTHDETSWWCNCFNCLCSYYSTFMVCESSPINSLIGQVGIAYQYPVSISLMPHFEGTDLCSWLLNKNKAKTIEVYLGKLHHYHLNNWLNLEYKSVMIIL